MQLKIVVNGLGGEIQENQVIKTFDDLDKLALRVGRAVKAWVRQTPMRKQGSHTELDVRAFWVERGGGEAEPESAGSAPARRRRKGKRGHAGGTNPEGAPGA
jgi:hypothetical protein